MTVKNITSTTETDAIARAAPQPMPSEGEAMLALADEMKATADNISPVQRTYPADTMIEWADRLRALAASPASDPERTALADELKRSVRIGDGPGRFVMSLDDNEMALIIAALLASSPPRQELESIIASGIAWGLGVARDVADETHGELWKRLNARLDAALGGRPAASPLGPGTRDTQPRVTDNDSGEISVTFNDKELRGWSYKDDAERRTKMLAAREYVEGWCDGRET